MGSVIYLGANMEDKKSREEIMFLQNEEMEVEENNNSDKLRAIFFWSIPL